MASALQTTQLSSNWKKLQAQLKAHSKDDPPRANVKRKRDEIDIDSAKRSKPSKQGRGNKITKKRMGGVFSSQDPNSKEKDYTALQKTFDVSAQDLSAAYGQAREVEYQDEINIGRNVKHKAGKYLALDCEMVGTGPPPHADDVLARVSIVNFHGDQIYDSYVMPSPGVKVHDYRTHVSGIQKHHMAEGHARSFQQVQEDVFALLKGNILVGHALRKDQQALQLNHPLRDIRDTSRYAPFRVESKGRTPALRNLAKSKLGMIIQEGEHSSLEDARATMMLFKLEKNGFEAEARKTFGVRRTFIKVDNVDADEPSSREVLPDEESEDDVESEDDLSDQSDEIPATSVTKAKKKRKKKKRTKR